METEKLKNLASSSTTIYTQGKDRGNVQNIVVVAKVTNHQVKTG